MYLLTRPLPKLNASLTAFRHAGVSVVGVATTDIRMLGDEESKMATYLRDGRSPDVIIVTSVFAAQSLLRCHQSPSPGTLVIAVGQATAALLRPVYHNLRVPDKQTSEGILALPELHRANCQHIVIIKGRGGRTELHNSLTTQHKNVTTWCVYERTRLSPPVISDEFELHAVRGIIATSEALGSQLLQHYSNQAISCIPWLTVSERVADSLRTQGVHDVSVSAGASDSALIEWIKNNWE